jgi:hypothetical protein
MQPALYLNILEGTYLYSLGAGGVQRYVLAPKKYWALGLNVQEVFGGLRIKSPDANFGLTLKWDYSLDGIGFKTSSTAIITEKSAADDYTGIFNAATELPPFGRIIAEVRATTGSTQVGAQVSVWQYMKYRV